MSHWGSFCSSSFGRLFALCTILWLAAPQFADAVPQGEWVETGPPLEIPRASITSLPPRASLVVLADGTPLLLGQISGAVQEYHPDTGEWTVQGSLREPGGGGSTATVLPDRVLLAGGLGVDGVSLRSTARIYDPATGTSTLTGPMKFPRLFHQATLLASGSVLVSGGRGASGEPVGPAEIYDPRTGTWTLTGSLNEPRASHVAVRLASGKVLVAGGDLPSGDRLASAEVYDPATGIWTLTAPMDRVRDSGGAVVLPDGRVLIAGFTTALGVSSEIYDPTSGTWAPSVAMPANISGELVLMLDGTPLAPGCRGSRSCDAGTAALYDVAADSWILTPPHRPTGPVAALADGRVLRIGGLFVDLFAVPPAAAALFRPDNSTPRLTAAAAVDFGAVHPGSVVEQAVSVQNTGEALLTGTVSTVSPFAIVSGSPFTIAPGQRTTVILQFAAPATAGTYSGVAQFRSNGNWLAVSMTPKVGAQLSGRITDEHGAGVAAVTVNVGGGATDSAVTDTNGAYRFVVPLNKRYTVTPASPGLAFAPNTRSLDVGTDDVGGQDFTAVAVGDAIDVFVTGLYESVFGRPPALVESAISTSFVRQHCNADGFRVLADQLFDSPEFRASRPLTLIGLVTALYRALLAREPEPAGLTNWVDVFRQERSDLASVFVESAEFQRLLADRTNRQAVTTIVAGLYTEILGRAPDAMGLTGWVDYIVATRDVEGTARAFVTSAEFEARALTSRDYVTLLYRGILGRNPDPSGLDGWDGLLRFDLLSAVNGSFISSAEFQGRIPQLCGKD